MTESHYPPKSPIEGDAPVEGATIADRAALGAPPPRRRRSGGNAGKVVLAIVVGLVFTGALLAIIIPAGNFGTDSDSDDAVPENSDGVRDFTPTTEEVFPVGDPQALTDLTVEGLAAIEAELGTAGRYVSLDLYADGYLVAEVQVPDAPQNVDRYVYRFDSGLIGPEPVQASTLPDDLEAALFDGASVGWEGFPALVARADELVAEATTVELDRPEGLTYVSIRSGQPFDDRILVTARFDGGTRHSGGSAEFTLTGEVVEVRPPS